MVLDNIFVSGLSRLIEVLLGAILYPIYCIVSMVSHWILILFTSITTLFTSINDMFSILISFFSQLFNLFPQPYGSIIILALTIIVAFRVYFIIRGS